MTKSVPGRPSRDSQPILLPGLRLMRTLALVAFGALLLAGPAHADIPASLKASCTSKTPATGYSYKFCDDGVPAAGGTTANVGGVNAVRVPAAYDAVGRRRLPGPSSEGARRGRDARLRHRGQHRARRRHLGPDAPRPRGRLPGRRDDARLLLGQQDELGGDELRRRRRELALQQRLVRLARLRRHQLHVARLRERAEPGLHRRDAARLAPLRDQRLPVPRRPAWPTTRTSTSIRRRSS